MSANCDNPNAGIGYKLDNFARKNMLADNCKAVNLPAVIHAQVACTISHDEMTTLPSTTSCGLYFASFNKDEAKAMPRYPIEYNMCRANTGACNATFKYRCQRERHDSERPCNDYMNCHISKNICDAVVEYSKSVCLDARCYDSHICDGDTHRCVDLCGGWIQSRDVALRGFVRLVLGGVFRCRDVTGEKWWNEVAEKLLCFNNAPASLGLYCYMDDGKFKALPYADDGDEELVSLLAKERKDFFSAMNIDIEKAESRFSLKEGEQEYLRIFTLPRPMGKEPLSLEWRQLRRLYCALILRLKLMGDGLSKTHRTLLEMDALHGSKL